MSKYCEVCGKKPVTGNTVSHAHNLTRRRWVPNLQRVRILENGVPKRKVVCAACLKAGKVTKYVPVKKAAVTPVP